MKDTLEGTRGIIAGNCVIRTADDESVFLRAGTEVVVCKESDWEPFVLLPASGGRFGRPI